MLNDQAYPYLSRDRLESSADSSNTRRSDLLWLWIWRLAILAVALLLITAVAVGIEAYRSIERGWIAHDLEQHTGCSVTFSHEYPYHHDMLPEFLRERVGEAFWADVREFSHFDWSSDRSGLTSEEVTAIVNGCRHFPRLRSFSIASNHFSCDQIGDWPSVKRIEELRICSTKLSDSDMAVIAKMSRLKSLKLDSARISAKGIAQLATLPRLESLGLYSFKFISSTNKPGNGFVALNELETESSPTIGDDVIDSIGSLPRLERAILLGTNVGDRGSARLVQGGRVATLVLKDARVTNEGLERVAACRALSFLNLQGTAITDEGLRALSGKTLQGLVLDGTVITDDGLCTITTIQGLEYLSLSDTRITGVGISCFDQGEPLPYITLDGAPLTREGLETLAKSRCTRLSVARTFIGDGELLLFVENDDLNELDVSETQVTMDGIRAFYKSRQQRLSRAGRKETLVVQTNFPEVVAGILGFDPRTGESP
jgi:hypothetical protein